MCNNKICCACVSIVVVICALAIGCYLLMQPITSYSELEKCPYCYGKEICAQFEDKAISVKLVSRVNFLNDKNVFYGDYNNVNIIVKKLATTAELRQFDNNVCYENGMGNGCDLGSIDDQQNYTQKIINYMDSTISEFKPFKVCSKTASDIIFDYFMEMRPLDVEREIFLKNVWTILKLNVEPLILQLLNPNKSWPLPNYYGSCGRLAVIENRGSTLLDKTDLPWMDRAYLALQLLQGAKNFTFDHHHLRFYLTDISADNIVVDDRLKLTFIDLEHLVVFHEKTHSNTSHRSEVIPDSNGFAYVQEDLCSHSVSDHNYYAICMLLLSKNAPYPMVKNGLLHSPPVHIAFKYQQLFTLIEECSTPDEKQPDRFESGRQIMDILNQILSEYKQNSTLKA